MELFGQVYDKYFHHFARTAEGKGLGEIISSSNLNDLRNLLAKDKVLGRGELLDLVILNGLYDEFYDDNYSRSAMLSILDSLILETKDNTNECCVCYEDTQFETKCKHSLCYKCFLKTHRRECPMCRTKFF